MFLMFSIIEIEGISSFYLYGITFVYQVFIAWILSEDIFFILHSLFYWKKHQNVENAWPNVYKTTTSLIYIFDVENA